MAASTGGPAGSPPRLRARRQARAAAHEDDEDEDEDEDNRVQRATKALATSDTRAVGDIIIDDRWTADDDKEDSRQLRVEGGQAAACGKSSERRKGEGRCRQGEDKQRGGGLQQQ